MKLNSVPRLLCLTFFLTLFCTIGTAQEEENSCSLPAPSTIAAYILGPDVLDVYWSAVAGSNGYDVQMIDLQTNQVLYQNTHFTTHVLIVGHIITSETIVAITPICPNGTPGDTGIGVPEGIHIEDLVLELDTPDNSMTVNCSASVEPISTYNDWNLGALRAELPFIRNNRSVNLNQNLVSVTANNLASTKAYSLYLLSQASNSVSVNATKLTQANPGYINSNTEWDPSLLNPDLIEIELSSPTAPFYVLDLLNTSTTNNGLPPDEVSMSFDPSLMSGITITSRNCVSGTRRPAFADDDDNTASLMSGGSSTPDQTAADARGQQEFTPSFYPNPATDQLQIHGQEGLQVQILDLTGRQRLNRTLDGVLQTLDISVLPSGSYIIQYFDGKQIKSERFLKL